MWIPTSAEQIERSAGRGELEETASFDGKLGLPAVPKKNISVAIDVAAMATDGGVLLYGVGEDSDKRLTILQPITLAGAEDRIGQIVTTSIAEVPHIEFRQYACTADPTRGYLAVIVPQSARAPHQVTVAGDLRFYGRSAKGNRILTEGEVARLYQRRHEWEQDRNQLLVRAVEQAPFQPDDELGYLHAFARPVAPDRAIWQAAVTAVGGCDELLEQLANDAKQARPAHGSYSPNLSTLHGWTRQGADAWLLSSVYGADAKPLYAADATLSIDGSGHLFCGRAAQIGNPGNIQPPTECLIIFEMIIAGNLASFLAIVGSLYRAAGYHGHVDVGLAITGLRGGHSHALTLQAHRFFFAERDSYNADTYARHERVAATELNDPESVAGRMLRDLFVATTGTRGLRRVRHQALGTTAAAAQRRGTSFTGG